MEDLKHVLGVTPHAHRSGAKGHQVNVTVMQHIVGSCLGSAICAYVHISYDVTYLVHAHAYAVPACQTVRMQMAMISECVTWLFFHTISFIWLCPQAPKLCAMPVEFGAYGEIKGVVLVTSQL
jgi:hypothetical protein